MDPVFDHRAPNPGPGDGADEIRGPSPISGQAQEEDPNQAKDDNQCCRPQRGELHHDLVESRKSESFNQHEGEPVEMLQPKPLFELPGQFDKKTDGERNE